MALTFNQVSNADDKTFGDVRGNWRMGDTAHTTNLLCGQYDGTGGPGAATDAITAADYMMKQLAAYSNAAPTSITAVLGRYTGVTIPNDTPGAGTAEFALFDVLQTGEPRSVRLAQKVPHFTGDVDALEALVSSTTWKAMIRPFTSVSDVQYAGLKGGQNIR